jgi:hypothetical protein
MGDVWSATVLGAVTGGGAFAAWTALFPRPPRLASLLDALDRDPDLVDTTAERALRTRMGERTLPLFENLGVHLDRSAADARIVGMALIDHVGSKVTCAFLPLTFTVAIWVLFVTAGVHAPSGLLLGVSVAGVVVGFVAPDLSLRRAADERRREFTLALGAYLDLVAVSLAGGMGTEAALTEAARVGDSWSFALLRRAVEVAQLNGATVWSTFERLGAELDVPALTELAASVALAGSEGARVRASIAVKADTLRAVELAAAETEAQEATERMAIPTAMLLFGFVLLIGFPAVMTVLGGL